MWEGGRSHLFRQKWVNGKKELMAVLAIYVLCSWSSCRIAWICHLIWRLIQILYMVITFSRNVLCHTLITRDSLWVNTSTQDTQHNKMSENIGSVWLTTPFIPPPKWGWGPRWTIWDTDKQKHYVQKKYPKGLFIIMEIIYYKTEDYFLSLRLVLSGLVDAYVSK